jgi:plastocyanin
MACIKYGVTVRRFYGDILRAYRAGSSFFSPSGLLNIITSLIDSKSVMDMKYTGIAALLLAALVIVWTGMAHAATPTPTPTAKYPDWAYVNIQGGAFVPDNVTIAKGGYVIWTNTDNSTNSLKFDGYEKKLGKGSALTRTYQNTGVYTYQNGMSPNRTARVIVK